MEYLSEWAFEYLAWGQGIFRVEADGLVARSSGPGEGAQMDPRQRRRHRVQYLHQDLSVLPRPV